MDHARGQTRGTVAAWRFVPTQSRAPSAFEESGFRARLSVALRAAHGLDAAVRLSYRAGAEPSVRLVAETPAAARWVSRVLAPVYGANQWVPTEREEPELATRAPRLVAHRILPREVRPTRPETGCTADAIVATLAALPSPSVLLWRWKPLASPRRAWWAGTVSEGAAAFGEPLPVARRREAHRFDPPPAAPEPALIGRLEGTLEVHSGRSAADPMPGARRALEVAISGASGGAVTFRRSWFGGTAGGGVSRGAGYLTRIEEWESLWPRPWTPASGGTSATEAGLGWLVLGRTATGGSVGPVVEPAQGRHLAILGETGMGKSSLLAAVAQRAFLRHGGVVFDPLGETAAAIAAELPPEARQRVIWVAPDPNAVGVNALEGMAGSEGEDSIRTERRLNDLVHALRRVRSGRYEESSYWGPRLEEMVTRAIRAAAALPRGTLVDAHLLLETGGRLGRPVPPTAVDPIRELADRIRERPEDRDGARRLLHEVVRSPVLVRMLCAPESPRRTRDLVAPGQVVLISGDAAHVGEATSRYLLSVYLALVWSELLAREVPAKTFVLLDEAQWFSHESLAEMLRLGRRRNVHVVLATQAIGSLPPAVGDAVWTNVADFVAFRGSPEEAREFARASRGVEAEEILALPRGHAAVLLGKGQFVRWVRTVQRPRGTAPGASDDGRLRPDPPPEVPRTDADGSALGRPGGTSSTEDADSEGPVIEEILRRLDGLPAGDPLTLGVEELRRSADPSGDGVRRIGARLGRRGLLERSGRAAGTGRWVVPADRIPDLRRELGRGSPVGSEAPQPS